MILLLYFTVSFPPRGSRAWSRSARAGWAPRASAAVPLCQPAPQAVLSLAVDASDSHVGGVLQQKCEKGWQHLAFFLQKSSLPLSPGIPRSTGSSSRHSSPSGISVFCSKVGSSLSLLITSLSSLPWPALLRHTPRASSDTLLLFQSSQLTSGTPQVQKMWLPTLFPGHQGSWTFQLQVCQSILSQRSACQQNRRGKPRRRPPSPMRSP